LEEFVEGQIVTFDGYADKNAKALFYTSHIYSDGVMDVANLNLHVNYYSLREIPKDLEEVGLKTIKAFDVRERFFHFEYFRRPSGDLVALEINLRPPGGFTMDMFNFANDFDLYDLYAQNVLGLKEEFHYKRPYYCLFISRKNHLSYKHSIEEIGQKYGSFILFQTKMPSGFSLMGHYAFIIRAKEKEKIQEITNFIWA